MAQFKAWFWQLESNQRFLLFIQIVREDWEEMVEAEDAAAEAARQGDGGGAEAAFGLARTRLAAFAAAPSDTTLEAAVIRRNEVPALGVQESAHTLCPTARAREG